MQENIKKIKEKIDKFGIVKFIIILIIAFLIFQSGIFIGYHKAMYYRSLENNYYRPFDQNQNRDSKKTYNFMQDTNLPGGHGAVGKIVSISLPNIVVASPDNVEKTVNISSDTLIRQFRDTANTADLKVGDFVIVLGDASSSDNGVVNAKLIRILPPPPAGGPTSDGPTGRPTNGIPQNNSQTTNPSNTSTSSKTI